MDLYSSGNNISKGGIINYLVDIISLDKGGVQIQDYGFKKVINLDSSELPDLSGLWNRRNDTATVGGISEISTESTGSSIRSHVDQVRVFTNYILNFRGC